MNSVAIAFTFLWITCAAEEYYYNPYNVTRSTLSGIQAYRSALTLDWLAAEDSRQHELAAAFETEASPPSRILRTDCISYARPSSGKVARLILELLKNLEGDDGKLVPGLVQVLVRTGLLVELSSLDVEPDLDSLVRTPGMMMGEPHVTFPRIMAMLWMTITDPSTTKKYGWCPISKVNTYVSANKPALIAKHMRALEPIVARARFIMEEFVQNITPLNMYEKKTTKTVKTTKASTARVYPPPLRRAGKPKPSTTVVIQVKSSELPPSPIAPEERYDPSTMHRVIDETEVVVSSNASCGRHLWSMLIVVVLCFLQ